MSAARNMLTRSAVPSLGVSLLGFGLLRQLVDASSWLGSALMVLGLVALVLALVDWASAIWQRERHHRTTDELRRGAFGRVPAQDLLELMKQLNDPAPHTRPPDSAQHPRAG